MVMYVLLGYKMVWCLRFNWYVYIGIIFFVVYIIIDIYNDNLSCWKKLFFFLNLNIYKLILKLFFFCLNIYILMILDILMIIINELLLYLWI